LIDREGGRGNLPRREEGRRESFLPPFFPPFRFTTKSTIDKEAISNIYYTEKLPYTI
jgi:hypothetical protein